MSLVLFDTPQTRTSLLPFTFTRPVSEIRVGISTIREKWLGYYDKVSVLTDSYLKFWTDTTEKDSIYVNGSVCPSQDLVDHIESLKNNQGMEYNGQIIAFKSGNSIQYGYEFTGDVVQLPAEINLRVVDKPWLIFKYNREEIEIDFQRITKGRESLPIDDPHTVVYDSNRIFLEPGAKVKSAILNAESGPIYLGKDSMVNEGAIIKGAFALGEGSHINMGAKVKGDTSIGPFCKVGGEVSNSVIFGYSNKGHDGFLGNSVLGEWCNIGADTNTSNLKNNYTNVKIWDYENSRFRDTGEQFCGLMMGDHSKCGINTMFNTGTVVGVGANIYGAGFPRTYIPSFSWGGAAGMATYKLEKFFETAELVMQRRQKKLNEVDREMLAYVYNQTEQNRK